MYLCMTLVVSTEQLKVVVFVAKTIDKQLHIVEKFGKSSVIHQTKAFQISSDLIFWLSSLCG